MWDWHWWCCLRSLQKHPHPHPPTETLLLVTQAPNDAVCPNCISFSALARMLTSWLNRRRRRYLFLILCSPFLLPLFLATCPLLCAVEICSFVRRKRRKAVADCGDRRSRRDDGGDEVGLLQRYLEDQLSLVVGSVYECGDDDENLREEDGVDVEYCDSARASSAIPQI
ncbi:hypothetical protein BUALT_Bualt08G0140900 [Buddleja alternifolia]|uniref:Uncharacterized protein n=1 Tax=Buddleja alternifolia TaxID=168488 RepID=A0AAV6X7V7_9LAMI|nr:hypothetical protein BUALT_Bualt08G0140900 [Buddleja alternifolia]